MMDLAAKLSVLADAAKYDASCSSSGSKKTRSGKGLGSTEGGGICHSYTPDGRCISLLKILLTNYCIFDCKYCVNRISSDVRRARFTTAEVVNLTLDFYRRNYIEGLFLSSGIIKDSDYTMEQLVNVAKSLRLDHHFRGYINLKTIPGAANELVTEAGLYADRVSVNIELPTSVDLENLAPEKNRPQLEQNMAAIHDKSDELIHDRKNGLKKVPLFAPAGQSTQMIVGATPTQDKAILETSAELYGRYRLRRVYYSAFSPIPHADNRLPLARPPLLREHRLYQADWMLRFYGFKVQEIVSDTHPELDINLDPKTSWALRNRGFFPLDVNLASKNALLRIPGVGPNSVNKIISMRRYSKIRLQDLVKMNVALNRAMPFVITSDYRPANGLTDQENLVNRFKPASVQLNLGI